MTYDANTAQMPTLRQKSPPTEQPGSISKLIRYLIGFFAFALMLPGLVNAQTTPTPIASGATINLALSVGQSLSQSYIGSGTLSNGYQIIGALPPGLSSATSSPPSSTFNAMIFFPGTLTTAGTYTFDVQVTPTNFSSPTGTPYITTFSVQVMPAPPVANPLNATIQANSSTNTLNPSITGNATGITISSPPAHGSAVANGLAINYVPAAGYVGSDTFTYFASGPGGTSVSAAISISVVAAAPTASPINVTVPANTNATPIVALISGNVTSLAIASMPSHGSVIVNGDLMMYSPTNGYVGNDTFTYTATGIGGTSAPATVSITIAAPPVISPISITVPANSSANPVIPNINGAATSVAVNTVPSHGTASVNGQAFSYTPTANYVGVDTFTYTVTGLGGTSLPAIVTVNVIGSPPTVNALNVTFQANSSANAITPTVTGVASSIALGTLPAHGVATVNGLAITYTPSANYVGSDTLSFTAVGPGGISAPATVSITVVATPPTIASFTFQANSVDNLVFQIASAPAGSIVVNAAPAHGNATANGPILTYTPNLNFVGNDVITYTVNGNNGAFASATANITVVAPVPTLSSASLSVVSGQAGSIDLANNVSGSVLAGLSISIASAPAHGTATLNGTVLSYVPARGYVGADSLNFTASAIGGISKAAVLSITVTARPDPSKDAGVVAMQSVGAATVRHFERAQLDNFNGRLTELNSNAPSKSSASKQCGNVAMWAARLSNLGSNKGPNGFDYNNSGTSIGGDRCFGNGSTVAGFGIGYGRERSTVNADGSFLRATAATGAAYGSLQLIPSLRFSWVAGVNQIDSSSDRYIEIGKTFAHGKWSGKQYLSSGSISHDFKFDQFFFVPFARLDLSRLSLDPYSETGGGSAALHYQAQTMSSQRTTIGFNGEYSFDTSFGELTPRMRLEYQRDFARRNPLQVTYADALDGVAYMIPADELDRRAFLASMGAELVMKNGVIIILNYAYSGANAGNSANGLQLRLSYKF